MNKHMRIFLLAVTVVVVAVAISVSGCSRDRLVSVSGTVTRNGRPVPNLVVFFGPEGGTKSWGLTDADGRYTLYQRPNAPGALLGTHKVWVEPARSAAAGDEPQKGLARQPKVDAQMQQILGKYGTYDITPLNIVIGQHGQVVDLALD